MGMREDLFAQDAAALHGPLIGRYRPLPGTVDEMMDRDGRLRPAWTQTIATLARFAPGELDRRFTTADRYLRDSGVYYRVYDDAAGIERPWPLSHVPLVIGAEEWAQLTDALVERAEVLDAVLADLYGPASFVADGVLPAAAVAGSPEFLRPLVGIAPRGGSHLGLYAVDLGRGPDGAWWVIGDRTQAPSGAGYALENRLAMSRAVPELYEGRDVERLAGFFQDLRATLSGVGASDSRVCVLTPGPLNETYFEHAYLARYLGFLLVEGADLTVREDAVFIRTVSGLKRTEVLWRRIDADFADPLELDTRSRLGVPGLVGAVRAGGVQIVNALGSGLIESRALMSFLPGMARRLLGRDARLPHVATWWCGQALEREAVLASFESFVIAPAFGARVPGVLDDGPVLVANLTPPERARLADAIRRRGVDFVAQEVVKLSTTPIWRDGRLEPRPFILRVFLARIGGRWRAMPGGFCRIADRPDARAVTLQRGGRTADVCVLSDAPVAMTTLLPRPDSVIIRRNTGSLPSRAADNLFWLGRYLERAEGTLRLARALGSNFVGAEDVGADAPARIVALLEGWGALAPDALYKTAAFVVATVLHRRDLPGALPQLANAARTAASVIRDRFSPDAWQAVSDLAALAGSSTESGVREGEGFERLEQSLRLLASLAGLAQENMNQLTGWRFHKLGRRIERAIVTCRFVRHFVLADKSDDGLDLLLALADSQITYRLRYVMVAARAPVLDLVVLDEANPRSIMFQILRIAEHLRALPGHRPEGPPAAVEALVGDLLAELDARKPDAIDLAFVRGVEERLMELSDDLTHDYFAHHDRAPKASEGPG